MNKEREIFDIFNDINADEGEFDNIDVELTDIEKRRIRNNYKKKILFKRFIRKSSIITAGLAATIYIAGVTVPVMATSNIPILSSIYEYLGIYSEYKDYTQYVGATKKAGKYEYTIEELMVTPNKSLIGVKITSDDVLPEDNFLIDCEIGGIHSNTGSSKEYRIDEHTVIITMENNYAKKITKKSDIKINIDSIDNNDDQRETRGAFEFKADFDKSYDESTSIDISSIKVDKYGIKLREIDSNIMETSIVSENSEESDKLEYVLKVDGKFYSGNKGTSKEITTYIENLKFNEVNNAKEIELLVYKAKYSLDELHEINESNLKNQAEPITENGISYIRQYEFGDGTTGLLYNLERMNDTVTVHYKGRESDIVILSQDFHICSNKVYYPVVYKDPEYSNEFIIEFKNIPENDMSLNMSFGMPVFNMEYTLIGEYKVK